MFVIGGNQYIRWLYVAMDKIAGLQELSGAGYLRYDTRYLGRIYLGNPLIERWPRKLFH